MMKKRKRFVSVKEHKKIVDKCLEKKVDEKYHYTLRDYQPGDTQCASQELSKLKQQLTERGGQERESVEVEGTEQRVRERVKKKNRPMWGSNPRPWD